MRTEKGKLTKSGKSIIRNNIKSWPYSERDKFIFDVDAAFEAWAANQSPEGLQRIQEVFGGDSRAQNQAAYAAANTELMKAMSALDNAVFNPDLISNRADGGNDIGDHRALVKAMAEQGDPGTHRAPPQQPETRTQTPLDRRTQLQNLINHPDTNDYFRQQYRNQLNTLTKSPDQMAAEHEQRVRETNASALDDIDIDGMLKEWDEAGVK